MNKPIINAANAPTHTGGHGTHFGYTMTELAGALDARQIGANLTRVPPGKAAFPFHHHHAIEEHFFVLQGTGVLRLGEASHAIGPHDYIVNLPGGPERAHQLINTGSEDLVYLAISNQTLPDVVDYPDSGKTMVATAAGEEVDCFLCEDTARRRRSNEEYWRGENGAHVAQILVRASAPTQSST